MAEPLRPTTAAEKACEYILLRIQTDPDLRYYIGAQTESFHLLCVAAAEYSGVPLKEVERVCAQDLQPPYRKRRAEVLELREKLEAAEVRADAALRGANGG